MEDLPLLPPVDPDFPATPVRIRTVWRSPSSKSSQSDDPQRPSSRPKVVLVLLGLLLLVLVLIVLKSPSSDGGRMSDSSVPSRTGTVLSAIGDRRGSVIVAMDGDPSARPIVADVNRAVRNGERVEVRMTPAPRIVSEPAPRPWSGLGLILEGLGLMLLAFPAVLVVINWVLGLPRRRRMRANATVLEHPETVQVRLVPWWSDRRRRVQLRFQVWPEGADRPIGSVRFLYDPRWFDPRGTFAMHGLARIGEPLAFRSIDRDLTLLPMATMAKVPAVAAHPCGPLVNRELGWQQAPAPIRAYSQHDGGVFREVPVSAPVVDNLLVAAAPASLRRVKRVAWLRLVAAVLVVVAVSVGIAAPTWLVFFLVIGTLTVRQAVWPTAGVRWCAAPLADAIQRCDALVPTDADFAARALLAGGFPRTVARPAGGG